MNGLIFGFHSPEQVPVLHALVNPSWHLTAVGAGRSASRFTVSGPAWFSSFGGRSLYAPNNVMVLSLEFGKKLYHYWGRHPRSYSFIRWVSCFGREKMLEKRVIEAIELQKGDTVLDLGCGSGVNLVHLHEVVGPAGKIIALDYSEEMLAVAKALAVENGWRNIQFIQGDAAKVELPRHSLDGAVCTFVLSAMPGEDAAIRTVATALKPHRKFVVFDAKPFTGIGRILNPITYLVFKYITNWNYRKNVVGILRQHFPNMVVTEFNSGCNFIAVAQQEK